MPYEIDYRLHRLQEGRSVAASECSNYEAEAFASETRLTESTIRSFVLRSTKDFLVLRQYRIVSGSNRAHDT